MSCPDHGFEWAARVPKEGRHTCVDELPAGGGVHLCRLCLARCITLPVGPLAAVLQRRCSCPSSSRCRVDAAAAAVRVAMAWWLRSAVRGF